MLRRKRNADRAADEDGPVRRLEGLGERGERPGGDPLGLVAGRDFRKKHCELVAGEAREQGRRQGPVRHFRLEHDPKPVRDHHQHLVALGMAEAVVDLLEAVEVDEHQGRAAVAGGEDPIRLAAEMDAVGERGHRIVHRHRLGVVEV